MAVEGVQLPLVSHDGNQPVVPTPQIDRDCGEVHPYTCRERQHRDRSSATSVATYAASVPGSTRTHTSAKVISTAAFRALPAASPTTLTGRRRIASVSRGAADTAPARSLRRRHRHHLNVPARISRFAQNRSTDWFDCSNAATISCHSSPFLRACIGSHSPAGSQPPEAFSGLAIPDGYSRTAPPPHSTTSRTTSASGCPGGRNSSRVTPSQSETRLGVRGRCAFRSPDRRPRHRRRTPHAPQTVIPPKTRGSEKSRLNSAIATHLNHSAEPTAAGAPCSRHTIAFWDTSSSIRRQRDSNVWCCSVCRCPSRAIASRSAGCSK